MKSKQVSEGFSVRYDEDGHWLLFESQGRSAGVCVEAAVSGPITKGAIISWIDTVLEDTND